MISFPPLLPKSLQDKKAAAQRAFREEDTDRSGFVDRSEFWRALRRLDPAISWVLSVIDGEMKRLMRLTVQEDSCCIFGIVDGNGNGQISETEFISYYTANF